MASIRAWFLRRWERRTGHVTVTAWLVDLGMPTPHAVRLKALHDKQHPDGWRDCRRCVDFWNDQYGHISPATLPDEVSP